MDCMATYELDARGLIVGCPSCGQKNRLTYQRLADPMRCARCKTSIPPPASPIDVHSTADFDRLVGSASLPIIVDYWAPWCGPCRMVGPELQKVATRQAGRALVIKVNTDELSDLGQRFGIKSIPTMAVFSGGKEVARSSGARPAADIEAFLEQAVAAPR